MGLKLTFTADLLNGTRAYVLAVIEHGTRRIRILGATEHLGRGRQSRPLRYPGAE